MQSASLRSDRQAMILCVDGFLSKNTLQLPRIGTVVPYGHKRTKACRSRSVKSDFGLPLVSPSLDYRYRRATRRNYIASA
jgi:hypothetical protein